MLLSICLIILGVVLLLVGGETLLRGAVGLATLLRLTPAVIGLTVVAAGTSVPELAVSATAAVQGKVDIAVANVVGSNIFNITVILGLCALVRPLMITGNTITLEYPVLAGMTVLCVLLAGDGQISRIDAIVFVVCYVLFTLYLVSLVRRQISVTEARTLRTEVAELTPSAADLALVTAATPAAAEVTPAAAEVTPAADRPRALTCAALVIAGIALLGGGAHATIVGAVQIARLLGWSERLIGLTIVSVGTGLPEVVASLVSSVRGRSDVAIGNVIGSNLFNILVILGLSGLASPLPVQAALVRSDLPWMLGVTLLLFFLLFTGRRVSRAEGLLLVGVYAIYLIMLLGGR